MADDDIQSFLRARYHDPALDVGTAKDAWPALPPLPPKAELRAPGPRPADPMQPLYENLSPTMGAYGAGQLLAEVYGHGKEGDWSGVADRLPLAASIFAGVKAKTANLPMLERAQAMAAKGAPREAVWSETGWFQGKDGKWRWEISDHNSSWRPREIDNTLAPPLAQLPEHLTHNALYEAYPEARNVTVLNQRGPYEGGWIGKFSDKPHDAIMEMNPETADPRSVALHEGQHGVSHTEGFVVGSNPDLLRLSDKRPATPEWVAYRASQEHPLRIELDRLRGSRAYQAEKSAQDMLWREKYQPKALELERQWVGRDDADGLARRRTALDAVKHAYRAEVAASDFPATKRANELGKAIYEAGLNLPRPAERYISPFEAYKRQIGEVEARNTQTRMNMTPEQRRATPPWETEDVPEALQWLGP